MLVIMEEGELPHEYFKVVEREKGNLVAYVFVFIKEKKEGIGEATAFITWGSTDFLTKYALSVVTLLLDKYKKYKIIRYHSSIISKRIYIHPEEVTEEELEEREKKIERKEEEKRRIQEKIEELQGELKERIAELKRLNTKKLELEAKSSLTKNEEKELKKLNDKIEGLKAETKEIEDLIEELEAMQVQ